MFSFFKILDYIFKTKQGMEKPDELLSETSFGFLELYFYISFIFLGVLAGGLWFLSFYYGSVIAGVFAFLFSLVLCVDIFIFIKVKNLFERISKKIVNYGKDKIFNKETIEVEVVSD